MREEFSRMGLLLGEEALSRLEGARVAVFGLGGVGGYTVEALARAGIGHLDLIDSDTVSVSNRNRQILATRSTLGLPKTEAAKRRVLDINEEAQVTPWELFYNAATADRNDLSKYDYIVDAIDTVTAKLLLIQRAHEVGTPIISCMGTGNKLDPTAFQVADISKTAMCPLARVMRKELRNRGVNHHTVLFSPEEPLTPASLEAPPPGRRSIPASVSWVPSVAGLMIAGHIVLDLTGRN